MAIPMFQYGIKVFNCCNEESFFMFNTKFYKQIDGVTVVSPLGTTQANIFMCSFLNKWLKNLKPVFDDIFALFSRRIAAENFKKYLASKHPNINFLLEKEHDSRLPFLDINIFRAKKTEFILLGQ